MGALLTKMYARWLVAVDTRPPKCPDLIDFRAPKTLAQPMNDTYPNTLSAHAPNGAVFVSQPPVWQVGGLMRALADAVSARFNPVRVQGEVSGFARAASGHCYFTLKDADAQVRCALFRRAASGVAVLPRDGDRVVVFGNSLFAIDGNFDVYGNGDFFMNSIDWAAQQENLLNLTTRPRTERIFTAPQSAWQFLLLVLIIVVIIPGMIVFFGISTWISRRRRG